MSGYGDKVHLKMGKHFFMSTKTSLSRFPDSMLARLVSDTWLEAADQSVGSDGQVSQPKIPEFTIQRSGTYFPIHSCIPQGPEWKCPTSQQSKSALLEEADFYGIQELVNLLREWEGPLNCGYKVKLDLDMRIIDKHAIYRTMLALASVPDDINAIVRLPLVYDAKCTQIRLILCTMWLCVYFVSVWRFRGCAW